MNSLKPVLAEYRLGKIVNKYLILDIIFFSCLRQRGFVFLHQASKNLRQLLRDNFKAALYLSEDALEHIEQLPRTISVFELPGISYEEAHFLLLSGDRLYTTAQETLHVFSMSDFTSPIATYELPGCYFPFLIADNRIFLNGFNNRSIIIYEISTSLTQPLIQLAKIETRS